MSSRQPYALKTHDRQGSASCFSFSTKVDGSNHPLTTSDPGGLVTSITYSATGIYTIVLNNFVFASAKFFLSLEGAVGGSQEWVAMSSWTAATSTLVVKTFGVGTALDLSADSTHRIDVLAFLSDFA